MLLKEGDRAPEFELENSGGKKIRLSDFSGKVVAIYFYPRDFTPGCTLESCNLRDNFSSLEKKGVVVLGISLDSVESHKKFIEKHNLPFELLADVDAVVSKKYGVYVQKNFFGKKFFGIKRTTFLVGKDGRIRKIFEKVDVSAHAGQILESL